MTPAPVLVGLADDEDTRRYARGWPATRPRPPRLWSASPTTPGPGRCRVQADDVKRAETTNSICCYRTAMSMTLRWQTHYAKPDATTDSSAATPKAR